jgi:2-dehydropantoate 2-reductase
MKLNALHLGVVGAGAVGGYFGGLLARAGHQVTLIARQAQAEAINSSGLRIESAQWQCHVGHPRLRAATHPAELRSAQGVLLCVKSGDTESASAQIGPHLGPDCWVMSLQNGVDNAARAQEVLQRPVIPALVYVAAAVTQTGIVQHFGRGDLVVGCPSPRVGEVFSDAALNEIADVFRQADIPVMVSNNVMHALWSKLLVNCAFNAISALAQVDYGTLSSHPTIRPVMHGIVEEVVRVARAGGIELDLHGGLEACEQIIVGMTRQRSSTAQDLARRKRSEIDHLNGFIVREGERLGIPTPINRTLHALVKLVESTF